MNAINSVNFRDWHSPIIFIRDARCEEKSRASQTAMPESAFRNGVYSRDLAYGSLTDEISAEGACVNEERNALRVREKDTPR